jgi:hypothetical protein
MTALDEPVDEGDDLRDVFGGLGIVRRRQQVHGASRFVVLLDVALRNRLRRRALLLRAVDDLVVDVGEVLHVDDAVALVLQVAAYDVGGEEWNEVTDVRLVLHGHATHVHADVIGMQRLELTLRACEAVVHPHAPWHSR